MNSSESAEICPESAIKQLIFSSKSIGNGRNKKTNPGHRQMGSGTQPFVAGGTYWPVKNHAKYEHLEGKCTRTIITKYIYQYTEISKNQKVKPIFGTSA